MVAKTKRVAVEVGHFVMGGTGLEPV